MFEAGYKNQHTKVVRLAACLSAEQRQGRVGEVIVKACRKLVMRRVKAGQLAAAAKLSEEMFRLVPGYVQDADKRRFNRVLKDIEGAGKKHSYKLLDASSPSSQALFTVTEGTDWSVVEERRLQGEERPDPAFRIAAVDEGGTWLLNGSRLIDGHEGMKSVLRRLNQGGCHVGDIRLSHDAYRVAGGFGRCGVSIMDSDGRLYFYDESSELGDGDRSPW